MSGSLQPSPKALETLEALKTAVAKALDRKRRLGQYAIIWSENRPVAVGDDAPRYLNGEYGHS
jgi:hypothetical protein